MHDSLHLTQQLRPCFPRRPPTPDILHSLPCTAAQVGNERVCPASLAAVPETFSLTMPSLCPRHSNTPGTPDHSQLCSVLPHVPLTPLL